MLSFNSLSRDHGITRLQERRSSTCVHHHLSTPSLGITQLLQPISVHPHMRSFQLPLSGSHYAGGTLGIISLISNFQLPLSGSHHQHETRRAIRHAFNSLSRDHPLSGSHDGRVVLICLEHTFNSLSRDHGKMPRMVLALILETGLTFNSLSRDHLIRALLNQILDRPSWNLSTPSLGITSNYMSLLQKSNTCRHILSTPSLGITFTISRENSSPPTSFQLPLSGSPAEFSED